MRFSQVVGQESIKEKLIQSALAGRVSHAQLFYGPEGCGNLPLAIAYARFLSCTDKQVHDSCGTCSSCIKYEKLIHPDLHFSFPVAATGTIPQKPVSSQFIRQWREAFLQNPYLTLFDWLSFIGIENKQGIINVFESHEILNKLALKPFESEFKVLIIWHPEKMNSEAANKLLKILEEPPDKTIFILVSQNFDAIIKTIVSRTQLIKIPRITDQLLERYLVEKFHLSEEAAFKQARLAEGNIQTFLIQDGSKNNSNNNFEEFRKWIKFSFKNDVVSLYAWLDEVVLTGREYQKNLLEYCGYMMREVLLFICTDGRLNRTVNEEKSFVLNFSPYITREMTQDIIREFENARTHIERNVNPRIVFFDLSLILCRIFAKRV